MNQVVHAPQISGILCSPYLIPECERKTCIVDLPYILIIWDMNYEEIFAILCVCVSNDNKIWLKSKDYNALPLWTVLVPSMFIISQENKQFRLIFTCKLQINMGYVMYLM